MSMEQHDFEPYRAQLVVFGIGYQVLGPGTGYKNAGRDAPRPKLS